MTWHNRNQFLSPFDPDYDDGYDPEEDYERYCQNLEERHEYERERERDGKEVNLDFHIVSEDGVVKHIEMIEKQE